MYGFIGIEKPVISQYYLLILLQQHVALLFVSVCVHTDVTTILFVVACDSYNLFLQEDPSKVQSLCT